MSGAGLGARPVVTVDGKSLPDEVGGALIDLYVDDHLHLPDMFALHFHDPNRDLVKKAGIDFASRVSITATRTTGEGTQEPLIVGEVTAIEADLTGHGGSTTVVRGYDMSNRLARGRRTATYRNMTDSDIARKLAGGAGLTIGQVDSTPGVLAHVSQANISDWDFLHGRAQLIGFEVGVVLGKFVFRKPVKAATGPSSADGETATQRLQLVLGDSLISFRPRVSSSAQVSDVTHRGWDPVAKKAIVGKAQAAVGHADIGVKTADLHAKFGSPSHTVVNQVPGDQNQADAAAAASALHIGSTAIEAEGVAVGDPTLKAGTPVSIGRAGAQFDGKYTLSSTRHVYSRDGYRTHFVVSGSQERSMLGLMSVGATTGTTGKSGPPLYGVYVGIVTDTNDSEGSLGRVKVKLPWLSDDYDSNWARVTQFGAGNKRGATFLPEVDDEVLVAFEHGDIQTPYVIGQLYNGKDAVPNLSDVVKGGKIAQRQLVSREGHRLLFDEDKGLTLELGSKGASLDFAKDDGKITIKANGDIEITGQKKITISSTSDIAVNTQGSLKLAATQSVSIEGMSVTITGKSGATVDGGAQTTIKGGMVQIN